MLLLGMAAMVLLAVMIRAGDPEPREIRSTPSGPVQLEGGGTPVRHSGVLRDTSAEGLAEVVPPERFRADAATVVIFSNAAVAQVCGDVIACAGRNAKGVPVIALPHPCALAGRELYATIVCHELGHVNGWPGEHGD